MYATRINDSVAKTHTHTTFSSTFLCSSCHEYSQAASGFRQNVTKKHIKKQQRGSALCGTTMTESKDAESFVVPTNLDNFVLKQWLYSVGPIHRCEALRKLKKDLQNLGYSRKQVYHGLVQLATKPHVILTRVTPSRRYGLKRPLDKNEKRSDKSCTKSVAFVEHSKHRYEKLLRPDIAKGVVENEDKQRQKSEASNTPITSSIESIQDSLASRGVSTLEDQPSGMFHSFEKVLEQFDKRMLSKMNFYKKSSTKRRSSTYSAKTTSIPHNKIWVNNENTGLGKHFVKDDNHLNNVQKNNSHTVHKVATNKVGMPNRGKKRHIRHSLSSSYSKKEDECTHSQSCKNVEMNYVKTDVDIKSHNEKEFTDSKVDFMMNKDSYSKRECEGNVLVDTDITEADENAKSKKKVHCIMNSVSAQRRKTIYALVNENNELDIRKRKQLRDKFRIYFGNYITSSEGEEEETILNARFKRRRKKDSIDSCDSGVSIGKTRKTINCIETEKDIQRCTSDCKKHEERFRQSVVNDVTTHESGEITKNITTTEQAKDVISVGKVVNKIKSAMRIKKCVETENKEIVFKDRSSIMGNTIISDVEKSQVTEQLAINISIIDAKGKAEVKVQQILKLDTEREQQMQLESATEVAERLQSQLEVETQPEVEIVQTQLEVEVQVQSEVEGAQARPEVEGVQLQPEVEGVQLQPEVEGIQLQLEVEGIQTQPQAEGVPAQSKVAESQAQEEERAEVQARVERVLGQLEVEKANAQERVEGEVEVRSAEIGRVEAQTRESIAVKETDINTSCETLRICTSDSDIDDGLHQSPESNLNTQIFNELLHMSFTDTCRITSNGNVLSIQETVGEEKRQNVMNTEVDENGNLKILPKMPHYNHGIQEDIPNNAQYNKNPIAKDIQHSIDTNKNMKDISINDVYNIPCTVNEPTVQDSKVNSVTEYKSTQKYSSTIPQCRLRVLSSAELGSRWCPTPTNNLTAPVKPKNSATMFEVPSECTAPPVVSSVQLETQTVPLTVAAPISTFVSTRDMNLQVVESVYVIFVKISNLIQSIRVSSPITKLDYNKLLLIEFEKLRKVLNTENYVALIEGVLCTLNKELVLSPPLTLSELFRYAPLVKSLYVHFLQNFKVSVNNANERQNISPSVIVSSQMTAGQNTYCNQKPSQNVTSVSVQTRLRDLLTVPSIKDQIANVIPKQLQQNAQVKTAVQPQNNTLQCNMGMSSIVNNHKTQQTNCKTSVQRASQQKIPYGYLVKHKPITNMYATQGFTSQYSGYSSTGNNPLDRRYVSASVTDTPCINQHYSPQCIAVPQVNAFYNVSPPNYLLQQNANSTYMNAPNLGLPLPNQQYQCTIPRQSVFNVPQGITIQSVPHVALNCIPQPVQAMFTTNITHSSSKAIQQTERIDQNMLPQVQSKVLQNHVFKQAPTSQHDQNARSTIIKQPVSNARKLANMPVSLESTTKLFDILKYLTNTQKIILLKHMDFYFSCTIWLEQQFTSVQWQRIHSQRSLLLHFQTLLKHLVEKTAKGVQNQFQGNATATNVPPNITIDVPKTAEPIVREDNEIYYQIGVSKPNQSKTQNTCENSMTGEENKNSTVEKQSIKGKEIDNLQNEKESSRSQEELVLPNEQDVAMDKLSKETALLQNNNLAVVPVLETETVSNITDQILDTEEETVNNGSEVVNDKLSDISDLKLSDEDIVQQSNLHLVTVEVSSNRDQVIVVEENESTYQDIKECDGIQEEKLDTSNQLPHLGSTICEETLTALVKIPNDNEHSNNEDANNYSPQELATSQIADVRSISLEAFEKMGYTEKGLSNITGMNIEEEEIKVCLLCGKSSTVACSVCLEAKYCSKTCFLLHWEKHYSDCTPVKSIYS